MATRARLEALAARAAGVALVEGLALVRHHAEGGSLVIVEGAQPDVLPALGLQSNVRADEFDEIGRFLHAIDVRAVTHGAPPCRVEARFGAPMLQRWIAMWPGKNPLSPVPHAPERERYPTPPATA